MTELKEYLRDNAEMIAAKKEDLEAAGFPTELEQLELYLSLSPLAAEWQTTRQPESLVEYQQTLSALIKNGWGGTVPTDARLEDEFMPEEYLVMIDGNK